MNSPRRLLVALAISTELITPVIALSQSSRERTSNSPPWRALNCRGVTQRSIGFGSTDSADQKSLDEMTIARKGKILTVTVNGEEAKKRLGRKDYFTDTYRIANESTHGLSAVSRASMDAVVHTLVITAVGDNAVWSESGVSWIQPYKPFIYVVSFSCTR